MENPVLIRSIIDSTKEKSAWSELAGWRGEVKYIRQTIIIGLTMDSNVSSSAITEKVNWSHSEMQRLNGTLGCYSHLALQKTTY